MKRISAILGRSALAGIVLAAAFCSGVALILCGAFWWIQQAGDGADDGELVETFVGGVENATTAKVVRVEITGEIGPPAPSPVGDLLGGALGSGDAGALDTFNAVRGRIQLATEDKDVKGLFLVIDSPGGDLTDSDILWHEIQLFREAQAGRFVLVHALAQCCSGGYYVATAADFIMVVPTSEVGSIGIISDYGYNVSDLARRFGVTNVVVATGENKDTFNPLKPVDPRQLAIEQGLVDSQFKRFVQVVAEGRKMDEEKVRALADGFSVADARRVKEIERTTNHDVLLKKLFGRKQAVQRAHRYRRRGLPVPRLRLVR